ncbi:hypothetical protein J0X20_02760 (plasmid) [Streptomyces sp. KCTC 0041BP]|uniref:hypothetical protein n=1 Tax=Streptomyces sp. KCTC 0041BP TaxID=201500 RepID=UPI001AE4458B|nr:hypothetical protein [Streptomyces sp. KCTC 0041BP]MBP0932541.1 hypothetical protein [Streptomyces sp. KCTC 0041BP]
MALAAAAQALRAAGLPGLPAGALVVLVSQAPGTADGTAREFTGPDPAALSSRWEAPPAKAAVVHLSHACASAAFAASFARTGCCPDSATPRWWSAPAPSTVRVPPAWTSSGP